MLVIYVHPSGDAYYPLRTSLIPKHAMPRDASLCCSCCLFCGCVWWDFVLTSPIFGRKVLGGFLRLGIAKNLVCFLVFISFLPCFSFLSAAARATMVPSPSDHQCYVVLCCAVLCCAVLCCVVLCCVVLCCVVLCCVVLCCVVLCCVVLCCVVLCCVVLCCVVAWTVRTTSGALPWADPKSKPLKTGVLKAASWRVRQWPPFEHNIALKMSPGTTTL